MIEKLTTKVSINTRGEAIRFANECYEVAEEFAIGFVEWFWEHHESFYSGERDYYLEFNQILEIYKKTL
jgi:hypothetical protein